MVEPSLSFHHHAYSRTGLDWTGLDQTKQKPHVCDCVCRECRAIVITNAIPEQLLLYRQTRRQAATSPKLPNNWSLNEFISKSEIIEIHHG